MFYKLEIIILQIEFYEVAKQANFKLLLLFFEKPPTLK